MTAKQIREGLLVLLGIMLLVWAMFIAATNPEPSVKQQWDQKYPANSER